jgi:hypothetical protein
MPPSVKPRSGGFDGVGDRGHSRAVEFPALPDQRDVEMVIGDLGQSRINELVREHPPPGSTYQLVVVDAGKLRRLRLPFSKEKKANGDLVWYSRPGEWRMTQHP